MKQDIYLRLIVKINNYEKLKDGIKTNINISVDNRMKFKDNLVKASLDELSFTFINMIANETNKLLNFLTDEELNQIITSEDYLEFVISKKHNTETYNYYLHSNNILKQFKEYEELIDKSAIVLEELLDLYNMLQNTEANDHILKTLDNAKDTKFLPKN